MGVRAGRSIKLVGVGVEEEIGIVDWAGGEVGGVAVRGITVFCREEAVA